MKQLIGSIPRLAADMESTIYERIQEGVSHSEAEYPHAGVLQLRSHLSEGESHEYHIVGRPAYDECYHNQSCHPQRLHLGFLEQLTPDRCLGQHVVGGLLAL